MALKINKKNGSNDAKPTTDAEFKASLGKGSVEVVMPHGATKTEEIPVKDILPYDGPMATVEVSMGLTRNLGNFESVRINVGVTLPCPATASDIDDTYHEAKSWVDSRIEQISSEIDEELGSK